MHRGKIPPRPALLLTVRFRERTRAQVIAAYSSDVMKGGMLIRTAQDPLIRLGTRVKLRFLLLDGQEILAGVGLVAWIQRRPNHLGVGVQFEQLSTEGERLYREMLNRSEETRAPGWPQEDVSAEFFEAPTGRVVRPGAPHITRA